MCRHSSFLRLEVSQHNMQLRQPDKLYVYRQCRHILQVCRPPCNISADCVNAPFKCVGLSVILLLSESTHTSCVSTCLWYFCYLSQCIYHVCRPIFDTSSNCVDACCMCVDLSVDFCFLSLSINLSITFILATYDIFLESLWFIVCHHQNQRSNNFPLFDDGNYE